MLQNEARKKREKRKKTPLHAALNTSISAARPSFKNATDNLLIKNYQRYQK